MRAKPKIKVFIVLASGAFFLAGMTDATARPDKFDVRGRITAIQVEAAEKGTIMIEGQGEADASIDKINVRITPETRIVNSADEKVKFAALQVGQRVAAKFDGPLVESHPVQATGAEIMILGIRATTRATSSDRAQLIPEADSPSDPAASENKHLPAPLQEFLAAVPGYSQASSFAILTEVTIPALARLFPKHHFFSLVFRIYPLARMVPAPLKEQNILIVPADGGVQHLTDTTQLENFFKGKLGRLRDDVGQKLAVQAWLALSQTFVQDGMFQFSVPSDSLELSRIETGTRATGKAVVAPEGGNRGEIIATLDFSPAGDLTSVKEERNVQPGVRPICQGTRLLDPDPIVRAMAAQDLVIMGRAAMPYLREQRKIAAPELIQAIDAISAQIEARENAWEKSRTPSPRP